MEIKNKKKYLRSNRNVFTAVKFYQYLQYVFLNGSQKI